MGVLLIIKRVHSNYTINSQGKDPRVDSLTWWTHREPHLTEAPLITWPTPKRAMMILWASRYYYHLRPCV